MVTLIDPDLVAQLSRRAYLDIDQLVESFDQPRREQNRKILDAFAQFLRKKELKIEPGLADSLVRMACGLAKSDEQSRSNGTAKATERGQFWLSFAVALGLSDAIKGECLELWLYGCALQLINEKPPETALQSLHDQFASLQFTPDAIENNTKSAIVFAIATLLSRGHSVPAATLGTGREWCEQLLAKSDFQDKLRVTAEQLGVQVKIPTKENNRPVSADELMIWKMPPVAAMENLQTELEDLLIELRSLLRREDSLLTVRTADQVRTLLPELALGNGRNPGHAAL